MQTVVIFGVPYTPAYYTSLNSAITVIFSMFPWCTLAKGVQDLSAATVSSSSPGEALVIQASSPHCPPPSLVTVLLNLLSFEEALSQMI